MAHRSIGPVSPISDRPRRSASLDELRAVIAWAPIAALLAGIYAAPKGEGVAASGAVPRAAARGLVRPLRRAARRGAR